MPIAVIAHGSGSSADFVNRAFGPALEAVGYTVVSWDECSGTLAQTITRLDALVARAGATLVGGVSLGAMAAACWAAARSPRIQLEGLLLTLPAWSGDPGVTAALSQLAADDIVRNGLDATLGRLAGQGWVGPELARAWRMYDEQQLVAALRATSCCVGPTLDQLRRISVPTGLVGFEDDVFHPIEVAEGWTGALPNAVLRRLALQAPVRDVGLIGHAAVEAWLHARSANNQAGPVPDPLPDSKDLTDLSGPR
jgi:pimeloyl-ACP methyl ester carboxylesterase